MSNFITVHTNRLETPIILNTLSRHIINKVHEWYKKRNKLFYQQQFEKYRREHTATDTSKQLQKNHRRQVTVQPIEPVPVYIHINPVSSNESTSSSTESSSECVSEDITLPPQPLPSPAESHALVHTTTDFSNRMFKHLIPDPQSFDWSQFGNPTSPSSASLPMNRTHPAPPTVSLTDRYLPPPTPVVPTTPHQNTSTRQKANPFKPKPLNTVMNSNKRKRISPLSNKPATYERPFLFKRRKTTAQSQAHPPSVINPPPASISSHHQSDQTSRKRPRSSSTPPSLNITADRPQAKKRKLLSLNQPTITYPYRFAFTPLDQSTTMVHGDSTDIQLKAIPPTDSNALPSQDLSSTSVSACGINTNVSPYTTPLYASANVSNTSTNSSSTHSSSGDDPTDVDYHQPSQG